MRTLLAIGSITTTLAMLLTNGCSGDTTVIIVQAGPDAAPTTTPPNPSPAPSADAGSDQADAAAPSVDGSRADADAGVDAGYDAGFRRNPDGSLFFDWDASLCDQLVVLQTPAEDPAGLGRVLLATGSSTTLRLSPPLEQGDAAQWCAERGASLPNVSQVVELYRTNSCPQLWLNRAAENIGPCAFWGDPNAAKPLVANYSPECAKPPLTRVTGAKPTLCFYR